MVSIRTVMAAVDLSDLSSRVLDYAYSLAASCDARLVLVHVVHDLEYFTGVYVSDTPVSELQHRLESEASEHLQALCQTARGAEIPFEILVATGRPVTEISRLMKQYDADCLVIGAHSAEKPEHQLFGSTAERLIQLSPCPIFMIPPRQVSDVISRG
jgi:nucleotide-binding universal stress UspA family protein